MNRDDRSAEGQAVLQYGALAIILPFAAALYWAATWAAIGFAVVAAATYFYQLFIFGLPDDYTTEHKRFVQAGCLAIWLLWDASFLLMLIGV